MYYSATKALEQRTLESLRLEVAKHREATDRFLLERTRGLNLPALTQQGALKRVFRSLQDVVPCFVDLGIINGQGRHLAYEGPYQLLSKNYKDAKWFKAVMEHGFYISDVFSGFRKVPPP